MIHKVNVNWGHTDVPAACLKQLEALCVQAGQDPRRRWLVTTSDTRLADRAERALQSAGFSRWDSRGQGLSKPHEYTVSHWREWEHSDLEAAEHLWISVDQLDEEANVSGFVEHDTSETLCVDSKDLPKGKYGFVGSSARVLCPEAVRERLEGERFWRLQFASIRIMKQASSSRRYIPVERHAPWWQLYSDLVLPPMSHVIERFDPRFGRGETLPRESSGPVGLRESLFNDLQPRYLRSEWRHVPAFDVGGSYELMGIGVYHRLLIVTNRVYRFCSAQGWKAKWVPVRVDEG